jgi:hypothetical protein
MRLPLFKKRITTKGIIQAILAFAFAAIAAVIILPQMDHQPWFPRQLGTYDFTQSIDFNSHTKITADLSGQEIEEWKMRRSLRTIHTRLSHADVEESHVELVPGESLTISLPEKYDEQFASALLAQGSIEFKEPIEEIDYEENPMLAFDPDNFRETDLAYSDITSAAITNVAEQFTYIELDLSGDTARDRWAAYSEKHPDGVIGLTIDGMHYQSWLIPAATTQSPNPTLVISEPEPRSLLIRSYLSDGPLLIESQLPQTEIAEPLYGDIETTRLGIILLALFAAGFMVRAFMFKEQPVQTLSAGFIIAGAIVIMKLVSLPLSIILLSGIAAAMLLLLFSPSRYHLGLLAFLAIASLPFRLAGPLDMQVLSLVFLVFGGFGVTSIFFLIFFDAYAE